MFNVQVKTTWAYSIDGPLKSIVNMFTSSFGEGEPSKLMLQSPESSVFGVLGAQSVLMDFSTKTIKLKLNIKHTGPTINVQQN